MSNKILQINVNRNASTTEHVLQTAIKLNISILVIQEPWVINSNNDYRSINHSSFTQILPNYGVFKFRTLFYVSRNFKANLVSISL